MTQEAPSSPSATAGFGHIEHKRVYIAIWISLLCLTVLTTGVAYFDLGGAWNTVVALLIAVFKASLVVLFFMHVRHVIERMIRVVIVAAVLFLALLIIVTIADIATRGMLSSPHWLIPSLLLW
jgi:cytochrome c oxidase subunit IV